MNGPSDAIERLEACRSFEGPVLDQDAVERIDQHVATQIAETSTHSSRNTSPARPSQRGAMRSVVALAVAAALVLIALLQTDPGVAELELVAAQDVTLELPDGTKRAAFPGDELVDGSIITIGPEGRAVIGATRLGPREAVRIEDGRIVRFDPSRALQPTRAEREAAAPTTPGSTTVRPTTTVRSPLPPRVARGVDTPPPRTTGTEHEAAAGRARATTGLHPATTVDHDEHDDHNQADLLDNHDNATTRYDDDLGTPSPLNLVFRPELPGSNTTSGTRSPAQRE